MKYAIVYDTETTGFPLRERDAGLTDIGQPHLVQIAAICVNLETFFPFLEFNTLIKHNGWTCNPKALEVHGKTEELCNATGMEEFEAVSMISALSSSALLRVAHNSDFDERIMAIAVARFGTPDLLVEWNSVPTFCTMKESTNVCKIPPTPKMLARGMGARYKPPSLNEVYRFFFNEDVQDAHDALADVRACARVFKELYTTEQK